MMSFQPNASSSARTVFLAVAASPAHMNTVCDAETLDTSTIASQFIVLERLDHLSTRKRFLLNLLSERFNPSPVWWQDVRDVDDGLVGQMLLSRRAQGFDSSSRRACS